MNKIKNIVFDFGGVLITDDDIGVLFDNDELLMKIPADQETLEKTWVKFWRDVGENRMTIIEFYNNFQKEILGSYDSVFSEEMFKVYKNKTHPLEPYFLLPKLKKRYKLFALTNIFREGLEFKKEKYNLADLFLKIIASCEVGTSKADPKIFQELLDQTRIDPGETLFIDDREKNTIAAKEFGIITHLYQNMSDLKNQFDELGIVYE